MSRWLCLLLASLLLAATGLGCGGDREKGIYRSLDDRPKSADQGD
ncbi:MAG: hypothetical protein ACK4RK_20805 [Gemmataceae bacterium]